MTIRATFKITRCMFTEVQKRA